MGAGGIGGPGLLASSNSRRTDRVRTDAAHTTYSLLVHQAAFNRQVYQELTIACPS